jgi:NAD(P)H dehydrogenase (quinone)
MTPRRVLVTGAGGKTGRAVIAALAARGAGVRALVRDPDRHADLVDLGRDVEVVRGDQREVDDLHAALEGTGAAYAVAPNVSPHERAMTLAMLAACRAAGVDRLVLHSVVHPQLRAMAHHADKALAEELVVESGLRWTILQPNAYLQNLAGYLDELRAGAYRVPYAVDRGLAMVDLRDVAEVAARCLVDDLGVHATFELSGPAEVSPEEVAALAGERLGTEVFARRQDPDDWAAEHEELDPETRQRLLAMFRHYDEHGSPGDATVLAALLGRTPRGLRGYLEEALRDASGRER